MMQRAIALDVRALMIAAVLIGVFAVVLFVYHRFMR